MPKISVLMPARDAAPWIDAALASVLRQSEADLELIAVDDASTDATHDRLRAAARRDRRLVVVRSDERVGIPRALELARARAGGAFVARQDADDVSHPRRFERQLARLRADPALAVVGACVSLFPTGRAGPGMARWARWHNALLTHETMANDALIDSVLCHGSAFFRAAALAGAGGWRDEAGPEDVDLWLRLLAGGARLGKCPERLYGWRQHARGATHTDPRYGKAAFHAARARGLGATFLRARAARVTLVGVGESLAAWQRTLAAAGHACDVVVAARPTRDALARLAPPVVLVFGALPARTRWRAALGRAGLVEREAFVFVA